MPPCNCHDLERKTIGHVAPGRTVILDSQPQQVHRVVLPNGDLQYHNLNCQIVAWIEHQKQPIKEMNMTAQEEMLMLIKQMKQDQEALQAQMAEKVRMRDAEVEAFKAEIHRMTLNYQQNMDIYRKGMAELVQQSQKMAEQIRDLKAQRAKEQPPPPPVLTMEEKAAKWEEMQEREKQKKLRKAQKAVEPKVELVQASLPVPPQPQVNPPDAPVVRENAESSKKAKKRRGKAKAKVQQESMPLNSRGEGR